MTSWFALYDPAGGPVEAEGARAMARALGAHLPDGPLEGTLVLAQAPGSPRSSGGRTLVADVRLDEADRLCQELGLPRGGPDDAALLLAAWERWGEECVDHLVGEFAFALWDEREKVLFCARDAMGHRPLFHARAGGVFACSNDFRAMLAWPGVSREVDELSIAATLVRGRLFMSETERTLFRDVAQLPAGQTLTVSSAGPRRRRYWSVWELAERPLERASRAEHLERFRALFREAVACRLQGSVGSHLSGGLDSTSVACQAAALLQEEGRELPCFTYVVPPGSEPPPRPGVSDREEPYVEAAAALHPNIRPHYETGRGVALFEGLQHQYYTTGIAHPNPWNQTWMDGICLQARGMGLEALLVGITGNMTLSWAGPPSWAWRAREWARVRWLGAEAVAGEGALATSALRPEWIGRLDLAERLEDRARRGRENGLDKGLTGLYRPYFLLRFGLEILDPTADQRVVEFCLRAPDSLNRRFRSRRMLVRDALRGLVPDRVLDRRTRQRQAADWREQTLAALPDLERMEKALSARELPSRFIDWEKCRERMARGLESGGVRDWHAGVMGALATGRFLAWVEEGCPAP